jgi:hypothetical protein
MVAPENRARAVGVLERLGFVEPVRRSRRD